MTCPATMRLVGLLVIVGMGVGCGEESTDPEGAAAVVGTYRLDVEKSVEQAVEMALVHDEVWKAARTEEERARARRAYVERERQAVEAEAPETLVLHMGGTYEFKSVSPILKRPLYQSGFWQASDGAITLTPTQEDGKPRAKPYRHTLVYRAGSLYAPPDVVRRARQSTRIGNVSEYGLLAIPLVLRVLTKE